MNSSPPDRTLTDLAERVETFPHDNGARTQRERHGQTDVRVLATIE